MPGTVLSIDFDEDNRRHWDIEIRDTKGRVHDLAFNADKHATAQPARAQADHDHD
ncbi:PepSY domain-containing protein [Streptomyces sp. NPDC091376]|uniref:PepSY domain-containing protein n=1 Tax=Streptomyces sp. NPDC091376 TaxID=3365994 RepID=UPI003803A1C0